ncbi:NADPH2:quinone reductase [Rhodobium orientis]|uniref:NADPH:quinone oxidoreductase n=1 Tax=Rhodobium orientis TaxID=34017 RepID=A0A327JJN8_9HYPH|nr:NADPH:quinone oxidoreductase family protein [Rhodobium orientis]MBB4305162.1 NADPH2:quinone reductase [Rhodobium orientis]MBK5949234.1 NADPH:quinone oxidoreductase [Rhodobium orientis]RAI26650.1 NADPH:quinone oxidoreductase [Rhodobium orientis]
MKAVLCTEHGGEDHLVLADVDEPVAGPGEAVVRVHAAALNFFDTLIIRGKYQFKPELPFSPGGEMAGTVESVGEGVDRLKPGDRVVGYLGWGCCREKVVAPEDQLIVLPDGVDFETASGLIIIYGTTLHALEERASLQPDETLVVLGASGGVGQAAIELGKILGARVIACASSEDKLDFCRSLGADDLVNYADGDLKQRLKDLTDGAGVDVVYDPVGGDHAEQALRALTFGGRFLVIGFASGEIPKIPLNLVLLKGIDVRGVFWGEAVARDPDRHRESISRLLGMVADGALKPHIHATYLLDEVPEALSEIRERRVKGKVVITP